MMKTHPVMAKVGTHSTTNVSSSATRCVGPLGKVLIVVVVVVAIAAGATVTSVLLTRNKGTTTAPSTNGTTAWFTSSPLFNTSTLSSPSTAINTSAVLSNSTLSTVVLSNSTLSTVVLSNSTLLTTSTSTASTVLGCYADFYPTSRSMPDAATTSNATTPSTCSTFCTSFGFPYSGTEYADECHCSAAAPTTLSSGCTMHCAGNSSLICGGANALSVVNSTIPVLPPTNSTKRGLCWPWNNPASSFAFFSPVAIPWLYNWELWDPRSHTYLSAEYVPMVHTQVEASTVPAYFTTCYATHLLGFNEPDLPVTSGGAYISPYNASVLWKQYIQPVKTRCNISLGAPAVTNAIASGWGTDWLIQFFGNCTSPNCTFDFIPFHWYGQSVSDFETYVTNFHTLFPTYPLWVTEFQFTGVSNTTTAYMVKQAMQWLDAQSYVARYAMFGPMNPANMAGIPNGAMVNDNLTALLPVGLAYAGLL